MMIMTEVERPSECERMNAQVTVDLSWWVLQHLLYEGYKFYFFKILLAVLFDQWVKAQKLLIRIAHIYYS